MPRQIIWSPNAENDFAEILNYLSIKWNNKIVNHFIDQLDSYLNVIDQNPKYFPLINKKLNIRKCVITKQNSLYYRASKDKIELIRLFDTRQNPDKLKFE